MEEEDVVKKYYFEGWGEKIAPWGLRFGRGIDKEGVEKKTKKGVGLWSSKKLCPMPKVSFICLIRVRNNENCFFFYTKLLQYLRIEGFSSEKDKIIYGEELKVGPVFKI